MIRGPLLTLIGVLMIVGGLTLAAHGAIRLSEPPYAPLPRNTYLMSGQVQDIGLGMIGALLGVIVYRCSKTQ